MFKFRLYQNLVNKRARDEAHRKLLPRPQRREPSVVANNGNHDSDQGEDHRLHNFDPGESEVEGLTARIEDRHKDRVTVMNTVRLRFVKTCRAIATQGNHELYKIPFSMLLEFRDQVRAESRSSWSQQHQHQHQQRGSSVFIMMLMTPLYNLMKAIGFRSHSEQLLGLLEKGIQIAEKQEEHWFYYMDFNVYYVQTEPRWPWMRSKNTVAALAVILFYLLVGPLFFCWLVPDPGICPADPTDQDRPYYGPVSALYFVSTTLSTVGYGDLGVTTDSNIQLLMGSLCMIMSNVMLIVAFSAAADSSTSVFTRMNTAILRWVWGKNESELEHEKVRRVLFFKLGQIVITFSLLNLVGVIVSRIAIPQQGWTWMASIYWAIQTTTTIGYGDMEMDFHLRWFQIFYLILSTYFVGNTLGELAALKEEIQEILSHTAWSRRELTREFIDEMQPYEHNGKIDQYEFTIGSLVTLGKVNYDDIVLIMDKFRALADRDTGFVELKEGDKMAKDKAFKSNSLDEMDMIKSESAELDFTHGTKAETQRTETSMSSFE